MIGIYKITSHKGSVYVGQSIDINRRRRSYKNLKCKAQIRVYNSLKKHGWDNHKFEVIQECKEEELNDLEVYYMELHQSLNSKSGLNLRGGGTNLAHSEETKRKISEANKGRKLTEEQIKKLSNALKGRVCSEERKKQISLMLSKRIHTEESKLRASLTHKRRFSESEWSLKFTGDKNPFYGKKHTEETKNKISELAKNRPGPSKEIREKIGVKLRIKINQYTMDGVFIKEWDSITNASAHLGIDASYIAKTCKGQHKQAKGFIFKYASIGMSYGMTTTLDFNGI